MAQCTILDSMLWQFGVAAVYVFLFVSLYFQVFMLVSFIEVRRRPRIPVPHPHADDDDLPTVAIIVPCFNEELTVGATIESLQALDYPADKLEIIVVDDGSKDGTLLTAQGYESDPRVRVFHKENGGKHTAMNFALERTQAAFIGCLDADSTVAPEALRHIVPLFQNEKVAAVTPGILIKKPETMLQHMQHAEYSLSVFNRFTLAALGSAFITPGPFSIFRMTAIREQGGWRHGHSTEDLEMALRIQQKGYLIANAPAATVHTGTPKSVRALIRQRVRWTYGFLRNAVDYRHMFGTGNYGNLGVIILPMALASIFIAIFFFIRIIYFFVQELIHYFVRYQILGFNLNAPSFDTFYFNTSTMWFLIYVAVALVVVLIALGAGLGTGKRALPKGTPLFVVFYSFLVPVWLTMAVIRAVFKTGVKWR